MIRAYHQNDKEELLTILMDNVPLYFHANEVNDFSKYLDAHFDYYLVLQEDGQIKGGSGWSYTGVENIGSIAWILCKPDEKGKGYGTRLIEHCLAHLREKPDLKRIIVRTSQLAFKFFQKFEFAVIRIEKDYWGPGLDLYYMEMKLHGPLK